jgi:hypothetical protein
MKTFQRVDWKPDRCRREALEFQALLARPRALKERDTILPFFRARPHLSAFLGLYHSSISRYDLVAYEYDLFGDFTCDLVVGDSESRAYGFIEFEGAAPRSIFVQPRHRATPAWSPQFEQGFSQVLDWFSKLDDQEKTDDFEDRFGRRTISYFGLLVIGRSGSLQPREMRRLQWREEKVLVNSRPVYCLTYDQLCQKVLTRMEVIRLGSPGRGR